MSGGLERTVVSPGDPLAGKRVGWEEASRASELLDTVEGNAHLEFLDQLPKGLLQHIIKESKRPLVKRLIEAAMVANDAALALIEADNFRRDPYKGADMYRRGGSTVVVGTGFGALGTWYEPTETFLTNAGHRVVIFGEDEFNLRPLEHQVPEFVAFVRDQAQIAGDKVDLWMHSKSGLLAYGAHLLHTRDMVDNVNHVVDVGTGLTHWVNPLILGGYYGSQLAFSGNDFEWARKLKGYAKSARMDGLKVTTISRKDDDPVMRGDPFGDKHIPITGSHIGNGWSLETMRLGEQALRAA